jgi:hypothetical protein
VSFPLLPPRSSLPFAELISIQLFYFLFVFIRFSVAPPHPPMYIVVVLSSPCDCSLCWLHVCRLAVFSMTRPNILDGEREEEALM